jgi:hypothetical protein
VPCLTKQDPRRQPQREEEISEVESIVDQITKKQHYVPQFYLKQFANPTGMLEVLDLKNKRIMKPHSYSAVAYARYFYAIEEGQHDQVSQEFEKWFAQIEDAIAREWSAIIERAENGAMNPRDFRIVSDFMSTQMLRTRAFQNQLRLNMENVDKILMKQQMENTDFEDGATVQYFQKILGKDVTKKDLDDAKALLISDDYSISRNNAQFLQHMINNVAGIANILYFQQWTVFKTLGQYKFITTENPVMEWMPKREEFWGASMIERKHYFAISPNCLIELSQPPLLDPFPSADEEWPGEPPPHETVKYLNVTSADEVLMYDGLLADHGGSYAYSTDRLELEELNNQIVNPGRPFLLYFQNYLSKGERGRKRD